MRVLVELAVNQSISDPVVIAKLLEQGLATEKKTRQAYVDEVGNDTKEWGNIIGKLGLSAR